ncbi:glutamate racemase [Neisseriaceae bacterium JH1-16]|nr:glutamate racemase [Neisseriaceae bacterium JH1-16]
MIGVFDSGLGGLSVWRELVKQLPDEAVLYLADRGYCPYGKRSAEQLRRRCEAITRYLISQGAEIIVIACNTATSAAAQHLRGQFSLPIVGMEPAVKPAALLSRRGKIGVLATEVTLAGDKFRELADRYRDQAEVLVQPAPRLVELVEHGDLDSAHARAVVAGQLEPLLAAGVDQIVLGCTHFPFLTPLMQELAGPHVALIDPAGAVCRQTARLLDQLRTSTAASANLAERYRFVSTDDAEGMRDFISRVLQRNTAVETLTLE